MTPNDETAFGKMLTGLAEAYRQELTPVQIELYLEGLRDVPLADVVEAAGRCLRTGKFFPTVSEIRDAAGANAPTLAQFWALFVTVRRWAKPWEHPDCTPALTRLVRETYGGWRTVGTMPEYQVRRLFESAFAQLVSDCRHDGTPMLPGERGAPRQVAATAPAPTVPRDVRALTQQLKAVR